MSGEPPIDNCDPKTTADECLKFALDAMASASAGHPPTLPHIRNVAGHALERIKELEAEIERLRAEMADGKPLEVLALRVREINRSNGWNVTEAGDWDASPYKIPAILALIHSEVSEALEAYRHNDPENFGEELADIIIRVLDCAPGLEVDIDAAIEVKLEKNAQRGHRHGGKRV